MWQRVVRKDPEPHVVPGGYGLAVEPSSVCRCVGMRLTVKHFRSYRKVERLYMSTLNKNINMTLLFLHPFVMR